MKNKIKSRSKYIACILCITAFLTGCSALSSLSDNDTVTDSEYVTVGNHLTVHKTDTRLTLLDNKDVLSADGLYYASWTSGNSEPYENSDGDTVDLYDAQLYLLIGEFKNSDAAQKNMENWLAAGQTNYNVTDESVVTCNGQSYTAITYNFQNEENPYSHGISAFGVCEDLAICVELTCRENYQEDIQSMLTDFLNNCSYH
ncbi:MAG: hypothetical protein J1E64_11510 [Acetatifactor sp.]|nr:hypothetical protein [Acetatifactor sp.]